MEPKTFFGFLFLLFVSISLFVYFISPFSDTEFLTTEKNSNFTQGFVTGDEDLQFYENMRFEDSRISYKINDCTLQKKQDMEDAFEVLDGLTLLEFYPVGSNEQISVSCSSQSKAEGGLFIAGEGGPTKITQAGNYNVIFEGSILLLRDSSCPEPNIAIHEILHVLGFNHSQNSNNIMYPVSKCSQEIGEDVLDKIDELYSVPSYPDLLFENVSAEISGRYLDTTFTVRNFGFKDSGEFNVFIYADGKLLKEIESESIPVGYGTTITLENVFVSQINVDQFEFVIESFGDELDKENNKISLSG